jgi:hypothetical protein
MIKELFLDIMDKYKIAKQQSFAGHPLADKIRNEFPSRISSFFPIYEGFYWVASPGIGRWAHAPWLAILDPQVTDTPQRKYYPVYLFSSNLSTVYLSLNQGVTQILDNDTPEIAIRILKSRAIILRNKLKNEYPLTFSDNPIDLRPPSKYSFLSLYEQGHAFGKKYERATFPDDTELIYDLNKMLELYVLGTQRGGA